ncbi:hypothetical protein PR048_015271 [Dryococelus australis]|uniref:Reverse transcriptase domain-containing protein n=1 Tax=Dryococelus australis TaxID=614101 RepID=A0ABQ9HGH5_9NEOP|nr:hypothetical protein PR048_015271 [Dryococelus australis]
MVARWTTHLLFHFTASSEAESTASCHWIAWMFPVVAKWSAVRAHQHGFFLPPGSTPLDQLRTCFPCMVLPWQPLCPTDQHILATVEESMVRTPSQACQFFCHVMLQDFPAEVFLQRPCIIKGLEHLDGLPLADPQFATPSAKDILLLSVEMVAAVMTGPQDQWTATCLPYPVWMGVGRYCVMCTGCPASVIIIGINSGKLKTYLGKPSCLLKTIGVSSTSRIPTCVTVRAGFLLPPQISHIVILMVVHLSDCRDCSIGYIGILTVGTNGKAAVSSTSELHSQPVYIIPHHAVVKEENLSPKVTSSGPCLNSVLLLGPKLISPVAITADVCKMYCQVVIYPVNCKFQCILWQNSTCDPVSIFGLNTVTYGLASSPFQALRTLQQLAIDEGAKYPFATHTLLHYLFVDDILTGAKTVSEALELKAQLVALLEAGGFQINKWCSNNSSVVNSTDSSEGTINFESTSLVKVLGIHWDPAKDQFCYKVKVPVVPTIKRSILSLIAWLYDPCGRLAPVVLWTRGLGWDEQVGGDVLNCQGCITLVISGESTKTHSSIRIPCSMPWVFEKAYAAVMYAQCERANGEVTVHLVTAKSKVAPLKTVSNSKLERCAAHLLCKLWQHVLNYSNLRLRVQYCMLGSTVASTRLRMSPHRLPTFGLTESQKFVHGVIFPRSVTQLTAYHGCLFDQLLGQSNWFSSPDWLLQQVEH